MNESEDLGFVKKGLSICVGVQVDAYTLQFALGELKLGSLHWYTVLEAWSPRLGLRSLGNGLQILP